MNQGNGIDARYFIIEERSIVPFEGTYEKWMDWMMAHNPIVNADRVGNILVSTVFNGKQGIVPANISIPETIKAITCLFSSSVFGGKLSGQASGYCTLDQAEEGHKRMLARVIEAEMGIAQI